MTPEERESIINEAVERALLALPDVWANLIIDHRAMSIATTRAGASSSSGAGSKYSTKTKTATPATS